MSLFTDASLVMIPSGIKDQKVYSVTPTDGSGDLTFSRGSDIEATRVNANGYIEKAQVNLLTYSNDFSNAAWTKLAASVTGGQTGYDGSSNAWLLENNSGIFATTRLQQSISLSSSIYTFSIYAKAGTTDIMRILIYDGATSGQTWFNFTTATFGNTASLVSTFAENIGGGWYRISITAQSAVATVAVFPSAASASSFCDAGDNILIQDAQLNYGLVAQDYVETTTAAVVSGITDDMPRLSYDPANPTCPSLLLEKSSTNLVADSEYLAGSYWSKAAVTVTSNDGTSPTGYNDAQSIIPNTSNTPHIVSRDLAVTSGNSYTASFFVKSAGYTSCAIRLGVGSLWAGGQGPTVVFDLDALTGSVIDGSGVTYKIEDYGNGWRRCSVTGSCVSSGTTSFLLYVKEYGSFAGDGTSGLLAFGGSLEAGSYPTSYIPTYGSSATRTGEYASNTGVSSIIGQTAGTLFIDIDLNGTISSDQQWLEVNNGTTSNRIYIGLYSIYALFRVVYGGTVVVNINNTLTVGNRYKMALTYENNSVKAFINGAKVGTDLSASIPACSTIYLNYNSNAQIEINTALLFPSVLAEADAITLTTL